MVALTDATGAVAAEYDYDAYGLPVTTGREGTVVNPFRYAGYYYDSETGMYYLNARYYRADLGRFITRDSFHGFEDDPASLNQYAYAKGNPVMNIDPSGHIVIPPVLLAAGVGALVGALGGLVAYFLDYGKQKVKWGILTKYMLRGVGWGMIGGIGFSGVSAGFISGAIIGAVDYFLSTSKNK